MFSSQSQRNHDKRVKIAEQVAKRLRNKEVVVLSSIDLKPFRSASTIFRAQMKSRFKQRVEEALGASIVLEEWRYDLGSSRRSDGALIKAVIRRSP